jgi:hypothetical protein
MALIARAFSSFRISLSVLGIVLRMRSITFNSSGHRAFGTRISSIHYMCGIVEGCRRRQRCSKARRGKRRERLELFFTTLALGGLLVQYCFNAPFYFVRVAQRLAHDIASSWTGTHGHLDLRYTARFTSHGVTGLYKVASLNA